MINRICLFMLSTLSSTAYADNYCASWGCDATIARLYVQADGNIFVGTDADETLANCTTVSNVYFTLTPSSTNNKEIYSTLLAAFMADRAISIRIVEGSTNCAIQYINFGQ